MKFLISILLVALLFFACNDNNSVETTAQERKIIETDSISIGCGWITGDKFIFEIEKETTLKKGLAKIQSSFFATAELRVMKITDTSWIFNWTIKDARISKRPNKLQNDILNNYKKISYDFIYTFNNEYQLLDWEKLHKSYSDIYDLIVKEQKRVNPSGIEMAYPATLPPYMYDNHNATLDLLAPEVGLLFSLLGLDITHHDTINTNIASNNSVTNDSLQQVLTVIHENTYDDYTCSIKVIQDIDGLELKNIVANLLLSMDTDREMSNTIEKELNKSNFDTKVITTYNMLLPLGLPDTLVRTKTVKFGGGTCIDKIKITLDEYIWAEPIW